MLRGKFTRSFYENQYGLNASVLACHWPYSSPTCWPVSTQFIVLMPIPQDCWGMATKFVSSSIYQCCDQVRGSALLLLPRVTLGISKSIEVLENFVKKPL